MISATLTTDPIDPAEAVRSVSHAGNGGVAVFIGTVREMADGRAVTGLDYTAYVGMAERELNAIAHEGAALVAGTDVAVAHRIGELDIGDIAVVVAAGHAHRAPAFDACRYVIEELKRRVPIWKRERYADGTREWVGIGDALGGALGAPVPTARESRDA